MPSDGTQEDLSEGSSPRRPQDKSPFLDLERYREGSLCLAGFMSEFWEGPRGWADLSSPHAQQIQSAWAGSAHSHQQPACPAIALQG